MRWMGLCVGAVWAMGCSSPPLGLETVVDGAATTSDIRIGEDAAEEAVPMLIPPNDGGADVLVLRIVDAGVHDVAPDRASEADASDADPDSEPAALDASDSSDAFDASDGDAATTVEASPPPPPGTCAPANCGTHSWACWRMPNSPNSGLPNPAHYTDMGDGIVRDDVTCLLWQRQAPATTAYTWSDAKLKCTQSPLLGGTGWRLPSRIELTSLVDYSRKDPTIALAVFPATLQSPPYWTWSPLPGTTDSFAVSFHLGEVLHATQSTMYLARCVRGNGESQDLPSDAPSDHYAIDVDTVLDTYTGLTWQRGDSRVASSVLMPYEAVERYCAGLAVGGGGWRLPSIKELSTLVDEARLGSELPAVDLAAFPSTSREPYWGAPRMLLSFADGTVVGGTAGFVRCVR